MAFGLPNPFGGSSDKDKNQSSSDHTSQETPPSTSSIFGGSGSSSNGSDFHGTNSSISSSSSSTDIKNRVQTAIATQSNVANAKALISKINENCFDHCVPAPGTSLSSREQGCLSACMEKYIEGWNVVSRTYVARLQREGAQMAGSNTASSTSQTSLF